MATSVRLLRRYVWLIDTIRRNGNITLDEINRKWLDERSLRLENEGAIPERTFHRHRQAIADLFGIDILCNRANGNTYYVDSDDCLRRPSFTARLFNGLAIDNQLLANRDIAARIMFDDTPGGSEHLPSVIEAMSKSRTVALTYRRFVSSEAADHEVAPLGLKQSQRRWYLIGRIEGFEAPTVFALDRIETLRITDRAFAPADAPDIASYFNEVVGVNLDDDYDCETVTLRIYGRQRAYVDTLPIHKSQRLIARARDHSDYALTLRPEYEFQHAILALGPNAEILSPQWLREEIQWLAAETARRYM